MAIIVDRNVGAISALVVGLLRVELARNELEKEGILFCLSLSFFLYDATQRVIFYPAGAYIK